MFADFVQTFQQHTVDKGRLGTHEIMYKYISTLEHLSPRFGTEIFPVSHLELREEGDGSSSYSNTTHAQGVSKDDFIAPATHEVMVSGTKGIQWRKVSCQKVCQNAISSVWFSNSVACFVFCQCGLSAHSVSLPRHKQTLTSGMTAWATWRKQNNCPANLMWTLPMNGPPSVISLK